MWKLRGGGLKSTSRCLVKESREARVCPSPVAKQGKAGVATCGDSACSGQCPSPGHPSKEAPNQSASWEVQGQETVHLALFTSVIQSWEPAGPECWRELSLENLRTTGARTYWVPARPELRPGTLHPQGLGDPTFQTNNGDTSSDTCILEGTKGQTVLKLGLRMHGSHICSSLIYSFIHSSSK